MTSHERGLGTPPLSMRRSGNGRRGVGPEPLEWPLISATTTVMSRMPVAAVDEIYSAFFR